MQANFNQIACRYRGIPTTILPVSVIINKEFSQAYPHNETQNFKRSTNHETIGTIPEQVENFTWRITDFAEGTDSDEPEASRA
ncbi:hypothetical protein ElyMa_001506000 [Elysia marginata]|uniref:Uncharacterized protein n=1 Tax=Elysia marginata TaxID=1093978 RepID=A0AAV4J821_9GAST|nr:hypothetical protein ElyMa_001506000 [Elysia marginata]